MVSGYDVPEMLFVKTGVFSLNKVEYIWDEIFYGHNVIDITMLELEKQFYGEVRVKYDNEHEDPLPDDYDFEEDELELVDWREKESYMDCCDTHNYYIGFKQDPENLDCYIEDEQAEYSCYIGDEDGFITRSKWICKAAPGSPCIPAQCCLDDERSERTEWAYTLPPDVWSKDLPEGMKIVKLKGPSVNLSRILLNRKLW